MEPLHNALSWAALRVEPSILLAELRGAGRGIREGLSGQGRDSRLGGGMRSRSLRPPQWQKSVSL